MFRPNMKMSMSTEIEEEAKVTSAMSQFIHTRPLIERAWLQPGLDHTTFLCVFVFIVIYV